MCVIQTLYNTPYLIVGFILATMNGIARLRRKMNFHQNGKGGVAVCYDLTVEWFHNFARTADHMPNCQIRVLPACLSKLFVYITYREQLGDNTIVGVSTFIYDVWKKHFVMS